MYDFMIKEILNPENTPERVNELLTLLLGQRVRIVDVLPNDGTRLADESTLLITDMVVQLEDGSIANLDTIFREKEVPVTQQICCFGSIRE